MKNRVVKQLTSLLLSTAMILSLMPTGIVYAEEGSSTEISTEATTEETTEGIEYQESSTEDTEVTTEDVTEAKTEETTEAVTEGTTEVTEEKTEATSEEKISETDEDKAEEKDQTNDIDNTDSEEESSDEEVSFIVFDHMYSDVDASQINTKELFVETDDPSVFTKNTTVESNYDNVYIISFGSVEEARFAYSYYVDKVSFITDMSNVVSLADEEASETDSEQEDVADMSSVNEGNDSIANLNDISTKNYKGYIALIDSGVATADAKLSVLGDDGSDTNGHGTRMYDYIKEENPDAKVLSIKAFSGSKTNIADVYAAIKLAVENKVSVINMSFVALDNEYNEILRDVIQEALDNGIVVIGAAGNYSGNAKTYLPGSLVGVTSVGAVNEDGTLYKTSNYNADIYVIATSTSEASARYSGIYTSGKDSDKVYKELTKDADENDEEENDLSDGEAKLMSGYNATKAAQWWNGTDKTSFPQTMNAWVTLTGNSSGTTRIADMTVSVGEPDNWTTLVPGYNWAYTWYGFTTSTLKSNLSSAVDAGALYKGDGSAVHYSDTSQSTNTYAYWSCIDKGSAYPTIDGGNDSAHLGWVKINDAIVNIDGTNYEYAYYGAVWDTDSGTQSVCFIIGFWKEAPKPWRRFIKVKKEDYLKFTPVTGCDLDVYTADGTKKVGDMVDNGDGTYSWWSEWLTNDNYQTVSVYEVKASGIYDNRYNNEKYIQTNGTLGNSAAALSTGYEYEDDTYTSYPIAYTADQEWYGYLRVKKVPEHPSLYNTTNYSLNGATFEVYTNLTDAQNGNNSIALLNTHNIAGTGDGYSDWLNVTSYIKVENGVPQPTTFYVKETAASKGYEENTEIKSVTVNVNSSAQTEITISEPEDTWVYLKKTSSNTSCTNGNPNYDLSGATYKIFDDKTKALNALNSKDYSQAFMTFVCDANGNTTKQEISSKMRPSTTGGFTTTTFYAVESAPGAKGYTRYGDVIEFTVTPTNDINNPALISVSDIPVDDPMALTVNKEDELYGTVEALEGVQFRLSFYAQDISTIRTAAWLKANCTADRTYIRTTDKNGIARINDITFPRGFVVVEEISNPDNYSMDNLHIYLNGDKTKEITNNLVLVTDAELTSDQTDYTQVTWYPNDATTYAELIGGKGTKFDNSTFSFLITNTPKRGNVQLEKMDDSTDEPMAHVKFRIKNLDTDEVHYFYTDEAGRATTVTTNYGSHVNYYDDVDDYDGTDDATVWFRKFKDTDGTIKEADPNNDFAALPLGNYEIKEMTCEANKGYQLEKAIKISITEDNQVVTIKDGEALDNENKIWNELKPTISTTAIVEDTDSKTLGQAQSDSNYDWTNQTIIDTCTFTKLRADTTYTLLTELMILDRNGDVTPYLDKDGNAYKRVKTYKTEAGYNKSRYEKDGEIIAELDSIDPTGLEEQQKKLVVYESLYYGSYDTVAKLEKAIEDGTIATRYEDYDEYDDMDFFPVEHKDKNDTYQTVTPGDIHTTIKDNVSEDRIAHTSTETTLTDSVYYTGLTVGEEYTVEAVLQAKEGTEWTTVKYDPLNPEADEDGYVYSTEANTDNSSTDENLPSTDDEEFNANPNKAYILKDAEGNPVTASKTFVAETSEGYVDIEFNFDSSLLEGKSVVAFEELKYKDIVIATHKDLSDEDETVHYPKFGTTSKNSKVETIIEGEEETAKEVAALAEGESFTDTIHFHNLLANRKYIAKGTLMDKETGEVMKDASGKEITAEVEFSTDDVAALEITASPDAFNFTTEDGKLLDLSSDHANYLCDGDVDVVFEGYDFTNLANKVGVVFEEIYLVKETTTVDVDDEGNPTESSSKSEVLVGEHKDIEDVDQFIYLIEVHTMATDKETGIPVVPQDKQTTILDTVSFKNVIVGKTYKLTATLKVVGDTSGKYKDGDTLLDKDGKPVTVDFEFKPEKTEGEVIVPIPFDTTNLRNMNIVVFEDLYNKPYNIKVACHNDLTDKDQTVRVPDGGTTAKDKATGDNVAQSGKTITLVDTITYKNLEPGKEYTATGTIYSKSTKKPIQSDGKDLTKTVKFTPTEPNGTVDVTFEFSTENLKGATLVVFEDVKYNNESVFLHADLNDEGQTVHIPEIGTTATVGNGQKSAQASKTITITDRVEYKNLIVGKEYTISGVLWNKSTSEKLVVNGKNVTASTTFKAEKADGYVDLTFTFDATGFSGDIVVGETLKHNDIEVATHTDLTDEGQTVTITPPPVTPPKTGLPYIPLALAGFGTLFALGFLIYQRKKSRR